MVPVGVDGEDLEAFEASLDAQPRTLTSGPRGTLFPPLGADLGVASLVFHQILPIPQKPGQARHSALPARSTQIPVSLAVLLERDRGLHGRAKHCSREPSRFVLTGLADHV